jgi:hypothetical protein
MFRFSRPDLLLFLACFFAFAYFNQGGGWNQNSRFAEVRAMAEEGRFAIDDFLVYVGDPATKDLFRAPLDHAEYDFDGKRHAVCWVDAEWTFFPISGKPKTEGIEEVPMHMVCASGDVAYVPKTGHFHPNKPPGTSFLALPAYWIIFKIERALGINPDHWWTLNLNAWLTTILSVGLISALGCVLFFRLACDFSGGAKAPALLATFALAFGTTFFPFGTILFDHNLTAMLLLASFYWLRPRTVRPALAGLCAGFAVVTNYVAGGAVVALGLYALLAGSVVNAPRQWHWRRAILYSLGGLLPAALLGWYHYVNFGSPFALNNDFQNPLFKDPRGSLGMFALPNLYVGALLLFSPYRGVFWLAPILILGVVGLVQWLRERNFVAEARLCLAIFGFFFLVNMSFNGYHGGFSAGPRYLIPGLPFLALPLALAFVRWKRTALVLLTISLVQQLLLTVTDAQNSLAVGGHARLDDEHRKDDFFCNIVTEYAWPLFATGRADGLLEQLLEARLDKEVDRLTAAGAGETEIESELAERRAEWRTAIERGEKDPFLLAAIRGPVSVNPVGVYDGLLGFGAFDMDSTPAAWASCNLGEFLWPQSRWSLLPLIVIGGTLVGAAFHSQRKTGH